MTERQSGLLGLLNVFAHVGSERWCSRGPCRAPVAAIFQWATACAGTIGGPEWTGVGMHTRHGWPVRTSLGYREWYRYGSHIRHHVSSPPPSQKASLTAFMMLLVSNLTFIIKTA